jgi:succinate dehydrogenase/fumarate reductase cytochrome b subunit
MFKEKYNKMKEKSLIERFLLIINVLVFICYFFLGVMVIFWDKFPFDIKMNYRIALGVVLISYSIVRFFRFINSNKE